MRTSRRQPVEKRRKECKEKNLPEPRNTPMTGTEEILDTLIKERKDQDAPSMLRLEGSVVVMLLQLIRSLGC